MVYSDTKIRDLIQSGVILSADPDGVGPVSYDLRTRGFYRSEDEDGVASVTLQPGESVFVGSVETLALPGNVCATVTLRNSRIRQGLQLAAPVYFPGHSTRVFFRLTNVSADAIELTKDDSFAQVMFSPVEGEVEHPYSGSFSGEMDYRGMGDYERRYSKQMRELDAKVDDIKAMESRIYGNVMTIMAVIAAVFTLVNVNIGLASADLSKIVLVNAVTVASFSALAGLLALVTKPKGRLAYVVPWVVSAVLYVVAVILAVI
ncbi:dCTP deaminase [Pseudoscardovia suis]|uniref:Deoxycytidine deaminase n=1 Tax=Pseudoscardovia suis TaxID=987063 RepID=A0A261F0Z3_9BIFI|nr:hypothetical protein [Pseudoscardovia suis]OZG52771.1 deoxycytidine deaminase [Pseudoscardovia suis]PJJ64946.1 deoxycytidine triphosphate deaminase [Pseudoscardovia suis]